MGNKRFGRFAERFSMKVNYHILLEDLLNIIF